MLVQRLRAVVHAKAAHAVDAASSDNPQTDKTDALLLETVWADEAAAVRRWHDNSSNVCLPNQKSY